MNRTLILAIAIVTLCGGTAQASCEISGWGGSGGSWSFSPPSVDVDGDGGDTHPDHTTDMHIHVDADGNITIHNPGVNGNPHAMASSGTR